MSSKRIGRLALPNGRSLSRMAYGVWRLSEAQDGSVNANLARIDACLAQASPPLTMPTSTAITAAKTCLARPSKPAPA